VIKFLKDSWVVPLTLLVTFGVIELGLRRFMPVDYRPPAGELPNVAGDIIYQGSSIPDLDYELSPNTKATTQGMTVAVNSYGMRDDEPDPQKNRRILVLGDSFSFGFGIPQEQTFSTLLERSLQATDEGYEVLNLAVPGYATKDQVVTLREKGMRWDPEVIIIGYVMNDPEVEAIQQIPAYFRDPSWWQYSHVLRLFARGKKRIDMLLKGGGDYYTYLHADRKSWASVVDGFYEIQQMASENDTKVFVVVYPDLWHGWDTYPYREVHQQVTGLARDNGFEVIDLLTHFSDYAPEALRVSATDGHPNELAHALTAQAIEEALRR
jgi:hypothetical protein